MLHGASIFTYMTGWFWTRANVGIHIPAPWFAYGHDEWYAMSLCGFAMFFQLNPGWCCDNVIVNIPYTIAPWFAYGIMYVPIVIIWYMNTIHMYFVLGWSTKVQWKDNSMQPSNLPMDDLADPFEGGDRRSCCR